jgi:hypothetical protein
MLRLERGIKGVRLEMVRLQRKKARTKNKAVPIDRIRKTPVLS